ncbi:arsenate reductase [Pedobacter sp. PLR]|uniref:arsenate reductase n=1 Tax=Pedobacter sp. PLR TaxID=2994465 RepID=UPI0022456705|nr:arsenate reductase [Pedobacter sp. PLR]MCX2450720.1 arsenate reductase [Pedobacter sp. PLR]
MIIYGIPNCNTVKKARTWLADQGLSPLFHDFKKQGITAEKLEEWCTVFGWEKVLNKKGTTWKKLSPEQQNSVVDTDSAVQILVNHTSAIKRPVVELDGKAVLIGFDEAAYETILK